MRRFTPYFESDGSYNEREYVKPKPRPPGLVLNFDQPIESQLPSPIFPDAAQRLESFRKALITLRDGGILPDRKTEHVKRQITAKATRAMHVYRQAKINAYEP
jgi:hypothetical protein